MKTTIVALSVLFSISSCITHKQDKGLVLPKTDVVALPFTTVRNLVVFPAELDGSVKSFILDTGAEQSVIHRTTPKGRVSKVKGATGEKSKTGNEVVESLKIGDMAFQHICALNLNFDYIEKEVPNFGGLIGQSVLSKANWLIDYPNKNLKISTKDVNTDGFETLNIKKIRDPNFPVSIDGENYSAFIDLGSSTAFSVVESSPLGKKLMAKLSFFDSPKETFTAAGVNTATVKKGILPTIKIGSTELKDTEMILLKSSSHDIRIGMRFFKDCQLYIDNTNGVYKIKKLK